MKKAKEKFIRDNICDICAEYTARLQRFERMKNLPEDDPDGWCTVAVQNYIEDFGVIKYTATAVDEIETGLCKYKDLFSLFPSLQTFDKLYFADLCRAVPSDPSAIEQEQQQVRLEVVIKYLVTYLLDTIYTIRKILCASRHYVRECVDKLNTDIDDIEGFLGGIASINDGDLGDYDDYDHLDNVAAWWGESVSVAFAHIDILQLAVLRRQMQGEIRKQSVESGYDYDI